jgi:hypothetical protein
MRSKQASPSGSRSGLRGGAKYTSDLNRNTRQQGCCARCLVCVLRWGARSRPRCMRRRRRPGAPAAAQSEYYGSATITVEGDGGFVRAVAGSRLIAPGNVLDLAGGLHPRPRDAVQREQPKCTAASRASPPSTASARQDNPRRKSHRLPYRCWASPVPSHAGSPAFEPVANQLRQLPILLIVEGGRGDRHDACLTVLHHWWWQISNARTSCSLFTPTTATLRPGQ